MSKPIRATIAIVAAGAALLFAAWFDSTVMLDIQAQGRAMFDSTGFALALSLGSLAVAGAVLLLAVLAWRSQSALVGTVFAVVGAFFAFLPAILWQFAAEHNDVPAVLPQPIAQAVTDIYIRSTGPLNAVVIIGAGMLLAGLTVLVRAYRDRDVSLASQPATTTDEQPARP